MNSLIVTIFNEEKSIIKFLESVYSQTILPDELIIVDGGSKDKTVSKILNFKQNRVKLKIKLLTKKGNRSVGRNYAIKNATGEIILSSDAGCVLDKHWVEQIVKPFKDKKTNVVAGYYKGLSSNSFEESLIPYVLVMDDKAGGNKEFLPATRSMAFKKSVWVKLKGFSEKLSHNEDFEFANRIKEQNFKIYFEKEAIVYWVPRKNLKQAFKMFFRFAFGDAEAGILRDKVLLIFARYLLLPYLAFLTYVYKSKFLLSGIVLCVILYIAWSIQKNNRYVKDPKKIFWLPVIQLTADAAVLLGTVFGLFKKIIVLPYKELFLRNKSLTLLIIVYVTTILSVITWGIPNVSHPFLYHMDEWHQLQSVRFVFKFGTPNLEGAANGTMFHFFYSGLLLLPFALLKIVNPFAIKSAVEAIPVQHMLFMILRLNTLLFGILTTLLIYKVSKLFKINPLLSVALFTFTPVWLMLSNYFKYDIALSFWIVLSVYCFIKYAKFPTLSNFILSGIVSGLALSVKVSAAPIFIVYLFSYFIFTSNLIKNSKTLLLGMLTFIITLVLFGIPDITFNGQSMSGYLFTNVVQVPNAINNLNIGYSYFSFVLLHHFPIIFGHAFFIFFSVSFLAFLGICIEGFIKKTQEFKLNIFLLFFFSVFLVSLIPLKIFIEANRALVLLPAMVLITGVVFKQVANHSKIVKTGLIVLVFLVLSLQILESYSWVALKYTVSPQAASSNWILKNISKGSVIGIENIPIYQFEPDIVLKEFYNIQYKTNLNTNYKYIVVDSKTEELPSVVIVSNVELSKTSEKTSAKKDLIKTLNNQGYAVAASFSPAFKFYSLFGNSYSYLHSGLIGYPSDLLIFIKK